MSINYDYYGTLDGANEYFSYRLHEFAWTNSSVLDHEKALLLATRCIDALNFKGVKHSVYLLDSTDSETIRQAEIDQVLEFPRGDDTEIPSAIEQACYEIAYQLLDGKDPEMELENLALESMTYAQVKATYARANIPVDNIMNMIVSVRGWQLLLPFLRDSEQVKLDRLS